jgi:hypothetical protein
MYYYINYRQKESTFSSDKLLASNVTEYADIQTTETGKKDYSRE